MPFWTVTQTPQQVSDWFFSSPHLVWRTKIRHYVRASTLGIRFAGKEGHPGLSPVNIEANPEHLWDSDTIHEQGGWVSIVHLIK